MALRHKQELAALGAIKDSVQLHQGPSIGAVWLVYQVARHLGIEQALGPSRQGRLALWQVIARVIDQGSRLSAVRLAATHAACDVLGLERFDEEDLYGNLDWLSVDITSTRAKTLMLATNRQPPRILVYCKALR